MSLRAFGWTAMAVMVAILAGAHVAGQQPVKAGTGGDDDLTKRARASMSA